MGLNWVITGGCGFLGVNLIHNLLSEGGHTVVVLDDLSVGTRKDLSTVCTFDENTIDKMNDGSNSVKLVVGDILDADLAQQVTKNANVIVHFAANTGVAPSVENPRKDMELNVLGTFNYLDAARLNKVDRFVFASSGAPAGEVEPPIHEELAPHPVSPYGASKLAGEGYCSAFNKSFGVDTVSLRFGNVYGPRSGHKSSVVAKFIRRALAGEVLEVFGDGTQTRDFIHVDELIAAVRKAQSVEGIGGETFQIATQNETSVAEMLEILQDTFEKHGIAKPEVTYTERSKGDVMRNFSDISKAKNMLGWQATIHLPEGLDETLGWFLEKQA